MTLQTNEQRIFKWWNQNWANKRREKKELKRSTGGMKPRCTSILCFSHCISVIFTFLSFFLSATSVAEQISEKREYKQIAMQSPSVREIDKQSIENCRFVIQNTGKSKTHSTHSKLIRECVYKTESKLAYDLQFFPCSFACIIVQAAQSSVCKCIRDVREYFSFFGLFIILLIFFVSFRFVHGILFREIICCWSSYGWCLYLSSGCLVVQNVQRTIAKVHINVPCSLFCVDCFSNNIHTR